MKKKKTDTYAIIGLGRFGSALAARLVESGKEVIVIDRDESAVRPLRDITEYAYVSDSLSREALLEMGIDQCDTVIIALTSHIDQNILTALNVKNLGVRRVIAKAGSADHGAVLEKLEVEVVYPERDMALRLANKLTKSSILDSIMLNDDIEIADFPAPENSIGKKIAELPIRKKYGLNIIAIEHEGKTEVQIDPQYALAPGDTLVVIGNKNNIAAFADSI
ncbi:MAG: potassium channel family protein [Candidatus Ornithomonoglobus sp.]